MKCSNFAAILGALASLISPTIAEETEWPILDNGLNEVVQWDHHSYLVNGQRLFIFSGEFHPWRFPVPELWRDLLEKIKAAGFNTFSIYNSWGYHSASPDALDFTNGGHNFTSILTLAKELGMYVIIRPGPYVNAETNAGGFPLWLTTGEFGDLRNDDERYTAAWKPYWEEISGLIEPHLITNGGNVILFQIENELSGQWKNIAKRVLNPTIANYMQLLEDSARDSGINIPFSHNAPNMNGYSWSKDFSNATGNVDVVGLDSYPSCWSCNLSECTGTNGEYVAYKTVEYYTYFTVQSPRQPNFMPEFQGGSYNPWGGPSGGCPSDIGADFANLFYRDLIAQRVTAISLYMMFGGTNWGHSACPVVATSYDYSSPVSENRALWSKYYETKLLVLFTRAAQDLGYTNRLGNGTNYTTNGAITTSELRNPDTNGAFYVVRHKDSTSDSKETFHITVETSEGKLKVPRFADTTTIDGHQSKVLVTDFKFGHKKLVYSTTEVLSYSVIDNKEVLALWLPEGEAGEFFVKGASRIKVSGISGNSTVKVHKETHGVTISYVQGQGTSIVKLSDGALVLLLDRDTAYRFWVPALDNNPVVLPNATVIVQGPYLVRSASYDEKQRTLNIDGDEEASTSVTVYASKKLKAITWNGKKAHIKSSNGIEHVISIQGPSDFDLEPLGTWKWANGLPEIEKEYEPTSAAWVVANKTTTPNPTEPADNNPVLYVDDYKIHYGNHIYRASFPSTEKPPTGVFLNVQGGLAFGYSVWVNSYYVGSYYGLSYVGESSETLSFKNATLKEEGDNILVVLMDQSGHELRDAAVESRGILNATLIGKGEYNFTEWKIAGNAGLEDNIDPVRGPMNEGSLYPERVGMHLPDYPEDDWNENSTNSTTLVVPSAGVRVFRTIAPLEVPSGLDVSISFRLTTTSDSSFEASNDSHTNRLRALLFVNGYQYGRFSPYIGHQKDFPVPPGVLNYNGDNTIVVTVWSQAAEGVEMNVEWFVEYVHSTSFDVGFDGSYLRPGWTKDRLQYA